MPETNRASDAPRSVTPATSKPLPFTVVTENAYRVLGLSAAASRADIQSAAGSIRRSLKLGAEKSTEFDALWLGSPQRTEGSLQHATGRLLDIERRLIERLFWFGPSGKLYVQPSTAGASLPAPGPNAAPEARHNYALFILSTATLSDPTFLNEPRWKTALTAWQAVGTADDYWLAMLETEQGGGFEPVANLDDVKGVRKQAVALAVAPIVEAAKGGVAGGDEAVARRALRILNEAGLDGEFKIKLENDIVGLAEAEIAKLCDEICKECWGKIAREDQAAKANRAPCTVASERLNAEAIPRLKRLERIAGQASIFAQRSRGDVADALAQIAACWTWADELIKSQDMLKCAMPLAEGTPLEQHVQKKIDDLKKPIQFKEDEVAAITKPPSLRTVNGIGTNLYSLGIKYPANPAWQYATLYFVVLFIPIVPLKRYLASPASGGGWYFHAKIKFGILQWMHLWFFALFVLLWIRP